MCENSLSQSPVVAIQKRQIFDIPEPKVEVIEHQAQTKYCRHCKKRVSARFPLDVVAPVQYGARIQGLCVYFRQQQLIPEDRLATLFEDIFDLPISATSIMNQANDFSKKVRPLTDRISEKLKISSIKHLDESGLRVESKLHWIHTLSNEKLTHYNITKKRGDIPIDLVGGTAVHDHFKSYFSGLSTDVNHALCGAHILRELQSLVEAKEVWARKMFRLLKLACHHAKKRKCSEKSLYFQKRSAKIELIYDRIVCDGLAFHEAQPLFPKPKRGRQKRRIGHNLAIRLRDYKSDVLRFLSDSEVPFTNNQAKYWI